MPSADGVVVLVGTGDAAALSTNGLRDAAALFANATAAQPAVAFVLPAGIDATEAASAVVEGIVLARYRWEVLKSKPAAVPLTTVTIVATDVDAARTGAALAPRSLVPPRWRATSPTPRPPPARPPASPTSPSRSAPPPG